MPIQYVIACGPVQHLRDRQFKMLRERSHFDHLITVTQHRTRFTIGGMRKCSNFGPTANAVIATCRPNLLTRSFAHSSARFAGSVRRLSSKEPVQTAAVSW